MQRQMFFGWAIVVWAILVLGLYAWANPRPCQITSQETRISCPETFSISSPSPSPATPQICQKWETWEAWDPQTNILQTHRRLLTQPIISKTGPEIRLEHASPFFMGIYLIPGFLLGLRLFVFATQTMFPGGAGGGLSVGHGMVVLVPFGLFVAGPLAMYIPLLAILPSCGES